MKTEQSPPDSPSPAPVAQTRGLKKITGWVGAKTSEAATALKRNADVISFEELYLTESRQLGAELNPDSIRVLKGVAGEPWVAFTPHDRFGLALSGGGIRSSTYNLGLTQALAQLGILRQVDYLSTVSGGGYIGGFWMRWLERRGAKPGHARFPVGNDQRGGERAEVRHLREFSRFLLPRAGLMETEFWGIMMTILGGLIPSFIAAVAMLFLCWCAWLAATGAVLWAKPDGAIALASLLAAYLLISELKWSRSGKSEWNGAALTGYILGSVAGAALVFFGSWFWPGMKAWLFPGATAPIIPRILLPSALLAAGTLVLLFARVGLARFFHRPAWVSALDGFERTLTRFLGLTASFFALGALWWLASTITGMFRLPATAGAALGSAALFAWAKKWLLSPVEETHGSNLLRTTVNHLKRATPKLLASLTWLLLFLVAAAALHRLGLDPENFPNARFYVVTLSALGVVVLTAFLFDPARVGMHEFYRSRISRCYLGASNLPENGQTHELAAANRQVIERPDDDVTLKDLRKVAKPVHLICTAANDVSGDTLATLYRGARSTVLSANGVSIGDETAPLDDLRLSSALTASAAAFNSHMGRVSMDLGPAVTFLMSALNLRLGLWVPHPKNRFRGRYLFPGRFFLYELAGHSRADGKHLHLSDGNHFENFGLYELIRRHVRYIVVSDCGADPEIAFDDLANVLRRVREDFGVEIDIDVAALRPDANGFARQHAVVGTIHYNGTAGMDKGTIVFFKPTLTGDEPPDVLQYRTRNRAFPHESTGDQFYDEPQWESYRRLGEHAARTVLGFFERPEGKITSEVDKIFRDARSQWHPAPARQQEGFLDMSERCVSLEADLLAHGPARLRAEVFSEAAELAGQSANAMPAPQEEMTTFSFLLRMTQIMEDVWLSADLEQYWSHPLNEGWMSYFDRWASTPSFRRWWPILAPIYSLGFREFAKERFGVGVVDRTARRGSERPIAAGELRLREVADRAEFMLSRPWVCYQQRHAGFAVPKDARLFAYELQLLGYDGKPSAQRLPIGFTVVSEEPFEPEAEDANRNQELWTATWRATEFYIPRALHGSGMLARMLDALIRNYEQGAAGRKFVRLEVQFARDRTDTPQSRTREKPKVISHAARQQRVRDIEFYKSRGFHYVKPEDPTTGEITLTLLLSGAA